MFGWIKHKISAHWNCWRINRWLRLRGLSVVQGAGVTFTAKLRAGGLSCEESLRRSFLTPEQAFLLLDEALGGGLSQVGVATVRGSSVFMSADFAETALLLVALADLASVLPGATRDKVATLIEEAKGHNWGGVARGAEVAQKHLEASGCFTKEAS